MKAEERRPAAAVRRASMWTPSRVTFKEICFEYMTEVWDKASGGGRLPTHWRQMFYVMRPICEREGCDGPLIDTTFKNILEGYLIQHRPGWDVLRGARGVFKEPHAADNDNGLAMSTLGVRDYLSDAGRSFDVKPRLSGRFPTSGARNRIAAVLICEKEGFDELLAAERVTDRYDLALMSTKGISALAARDLANRLGVPCFTLHDLDKNGFVMAAGFPFATDLGLSLADADELQLEPEHQGHKNPERAYDNLIRNGATPEEADFIAYQEQRVELNMMTSDAFVEFVEGKLIEHGVEKVVPDEATLAEAWTRVHVVHAANRLIDGMWQGAWEARSVAEPPVPPADLAKRIRDLIEDSALAWDDALWTLVRDGDDAK